MITTMRMIKNNNKKAIFVEKDPESESANAIEEMKKKRQNIAKRIETIQNIIARWQRDMERYERVDDQYQKIINNMEEFNKEMLNVEKQILINQFIDFAVDEKEVVVKAFAQFLKKRYANKVWMSGKMIELTLSVSEQENDIIVTTYVCAEKKVFFIQTKYAKEQFLENMQTDDIVLLFQKGYVEMTFEQVNKATSLEGMNKVPQEIFKVKC